MPNITPPESSRSSSCKDAKGKLEWDIAEERKDEASNPGPPMNEGVETAVDEQQQHSQPQENWMPSIGKKFEPMTTGLVEPSGTTAQLKPKDGNQKNEGKETAADEQ